MIDRNKKVVLEYFDTVGGGSVEAVRKAVTNTMSDDVVWHVPVSAPNGGTTTGRPAVLDLLTGTEGVSLYREGTMDVNLGQLIGEDDFVVAPFSFKAVTRKGINYENYFIFVFRLAGGKIVEFWETFDTAEMLRVHFNRSIGA